jgi:transcriptional regulator with XRE-family HTH domain
MQQKPARTGVTEIQRILAVNVKRRRQALGLTVKAASRRARLHWRHWQKIEAKEVNATLDTLVRLADALEVKLYALVLSSESIVAAEQRAERLVDELLANPGLRERLLRLFTKELP